MVAAGLWLSHSLIPLDRDGHGRLMQENIRNAGELYTLLRDFPNLARGIHVQAVPLCEPNSNIVCFAFAPRTGRRTLRDINKANSEIYQEFSFGTPVSQPEYFVSRTVLSSSRYQWRTVSSFVETLGASESEYAESGVFVLRSVLMNPWYVRAKERGSYFISDFVARLYSKASECFGS
jgi:hypothetical protein